MSKPKPQTVPAAPAALRYVGGLPFVTVVFLSGRSISASHGDVVDLLPVEVDALTGHPDWEPVPTPDPDTPKE